MEKLKRIRIVFKDEEILSDTQKLEGLGRCWVLLNHRELCTVADVISYFLDVFRLRKSCPDGLVLSISGFVLPPFESSCILKGNEIIRVRKKRKDILCIEGNHTAEVEKLEKKQESQVDNGVLALEFKKQRRAYEGEDPEEGSDDVDERSDSGRGPKNRKRKAANKLLHSKKKKKCNVATGSASESDLLEKLDNILLDGAPTGGNAHFTSKEKDSINPDDIIVNTAENVDADDNDHASDSDMKRNSDLEGNDNEIQVIKIKPTVTRKGPSRSARRKYAKRRWLREMAKIQKQNTTSESEGLRNWKEDQAKAKGNKHKWMKSCDDLYANVQDDEPKGLLHWKPSSKNDPSCKGKKRGWNKEHLHKPSLHASDADKCKKFYDNLQPTMNGSAYGSETPEGDVHEQPSTKNIAIEEHQNGDSPEKLDETTEENEVVPIVIRPGHIRFEPLEDAEKGDQLPSEIFQWNGITSKKKGQKWGKEDRSFTCQNSNNENSVVPSIDEEKQPDKIDFEKLPYLILPKAGQLIAYRFLELSSTWTPELSNFRVGKVSSYDAESYQTLLLPVPEYPIFPNTDEHANVLPDNSLYNPDGSLEIDFSSLSDVRLITESLESEAKGFKNLSNGSISNENTQRSQNIEAIPESGHAKKAQLTETGADIWEQLSEAVAAKKDQLSQNRWNKTRVSKNENEPPEKVGNRSWSYKALRGSGLGPTMAILRSKKHF